MKTLKLFTLLLFLITAVQAQQVKFIQAQPEAGKALNFSYDPEGTALEKSTDILCRAYLYSLNTTKSTKINLIKEGVLYRAEIPTTDSTTLVVLSFSAGDTRDENPDGYYTLLHRDGEVPAEAYANEANILDVYGKSYFGMKPNLEKSLAAYEQAFAINPLLKDKLRYKYVSVIYRQNKEAGTKLVNDQIDYLATSKSTEEKDLTLVYDLYSLIKNKEKADSAKYTLLKTYPTGNMAYSLAARELYTEKSARVFEEKLNGLIARFKIQPNADKLTYLYNLLATAYAKEKTFEKFDLYANKISNKVTRAGIYNNVAWPFAEKNTNTAFALSISKKSLDLLTAAKDDEFPSYYDSKAEYLKSLDSYYGMYADTYALLLYNSGKYKDALTYQDKAFALMETGSADMHVRYVTYLKKDGQFAKAFTEAENLIKEGDATDSVKTDFKMLYTKLGKKGDYNTYLSKLEEAAYAKEREKWQKKMINMPAPTFSLASLKGETVSLADFKGKTVIVDYWATWCGPCVASFPGMQLAINKYKNNPNVVFLFINTW